MASKSMQEFLNALLNECIEEVQVLTTQVLQ